LVADELELFDDPELEDPELVECLVVLELDLLEAVLVPADAFAHPLNPESVTNPLSDHILRCLLLAAFSSLSYFERYLYGGL
ncbi:hypothetical protein, partial [Parvimonas micra]|uniref:hypothetical protein n=1 Tax=Parvimonas micra TaxID=33033 RepID=UPI002B459376